MNSNTREFFDNASEFYDDMISFKKHLENRIKAFKQFLPPDKLDIADLGSGSGLDTVAAGCLGHKVTSFDISPDMLARLKENAAAYKLASTTECCSITDISGAYNGSFDWVLSLGNTLALIPGEELSAAFKKISAILKPGGGFLMQILNYTRLLSEKERIVAVTSNENSYFVRFYDFEADFLNFNILKFDRNKPEIRELITTRLYPHRSDAITSFAENAGLVLQGNWGKLNKEEWDPKNSKDYIAGFVKV